MAEAFKNIYNERFFNDFITVISKVIPEFNTKSFLHSIFDQEWEKRELKQRMRHISIVLKAHLTEEYTTNIDIIVQMIRQLQKDGIKENSIEYMFFPDFIEVYGLPYEDISIKAFEEITQFTSCEFAVRPFIIKEPEKMMKQMFLWATHKHPMVRRLASEGCRPRLPWAMAIPAFKKDPTPILPILEQLKNDTSESVRRSVANNLNDIAKDNPKVVIDRSKKWQGKTKETDGLIKHGCRTLLKAGNAEVMQLFGFGSHEHIAITNVQIVTPKVKIGTHLEFTFDLRNTSASTTKIRLEYALYYQKSKGTLSKKVFKISEKIYPNDSITTIRRKQSFKIITTRKFYTGEHRVAIIGNGKEFEAHTFELVDS